MIPHILGVRHLAFVPDQSLVPVRFGATLDLVKGLSAFLGAAPDLIKPTLHLYMATDRLANSSHPRRPYSVFRGNPLSPSLEIVGLNVEDPLQFPLSLAAL